MSTMALNSFIGKHEGKLKAVELEIMHSARRCKATFIELY